MQYVCKTVLIERLHTMCDCRRDVYVNLRNLFKILKLFYTVKSGESMGSVWCSVFPFRELHKSVTKKLKKNLDEGSLGEDEGGFSSLFYTTVEPFK
jgi:hypothetical protein